MWIKQKHLLGFSVFVVSLAAAFILGGGRAHAATLNVAGGCTVSIAIDSVNAGSNQSGCTASGGYGTNDTINIPAGTQTLTADLPDVTASVVIQGAGMTDTTIDGDNGTYHEFTLTGNTTVTIQDLKVTGFLGHGISSAISNLTLSRIEADGANSVPEFNFLYGIGVAGQASGNNQVTATDIYIHNFDASVNQLAGFLATQDDSNTTTASFNRVTVSDMTNHNTNSVLYGFNIAVGALPNPFASTGSGIYNATITNTTVHNLVNTTGTVAAFGGSAMAHGAPSTVNMTIQNATITGSRGTIGLLGNNTLALFGVGVSFGSALATVDGTVQNTIMADNLTDTTPTNCLFGDFSSLLGQSGPVATNITSLGSNITDDHTCASFTQPGDQQGLNNIITTLGPLQNNGGVAPTRALLPGSPAIGIGGQVLGITTDARGVARSSSCPSIGAYQYVGACTAVAGSSGGGSLANTGQNTKASMVIGTFMISSALVLTIAKRNAIYKRR